MSKPPGQKWKDEFSERVKSYVLRGDYRSAVGFTKSTLKKYPNEFVCRFQYAKVLGDYADELPPNQKMKLKKEAIRILRPLLRSLRGIPTDLRFSVCLNYYYQSESFKKMSAFGKRFQSADRQKGLYAQALGATLVAHELFEKGSTRSARSWAEKANKAWSRYDFSKEKYYFPHYNQAKALAILGDKKNALVRLKKAAKLSKRPVTDWEFADVLKLI